MACKIWAEEIFGSSLLQPVNNNISKIDRIVMFVFIIVLLFDFCCKGNDYNLDIQIKYEKYIIWTTALSFMISFRGQLRAKGAEVVVA